MSQFDFGTIDPYVVDGVQLADFLNRWRDAIHSWHRGAVPPTYVVPGMMWIDDSGGPTNWLVKVYMSVGVGSVSIFTYNTTTGAIGFVTGTSPLSAAILLASATAGPRVEWNATANPIDQKNWRATDTNTGALRFGVYNDAGVETAWIQFNRDGTVTSSAALLFAHPAARFEPPNWSWGQTTYIRVANLSTIYNFGAGTMTPGGGGGVWTPGVGYWKITAAMWIVNNTAANTQVNMTMRKNGSTAYIASGVVIIASGYATSLLMSWSGQLTATDTIEYGGDVSGGGALSFTGGPLSYIEGFRLR